MSLATIVSIAALAVLVGWLAVVGGRKLRGYTRTFWRNFWPHNW